MVLLDQFFYIFWGESEDDLHCQRCLLSFNKREREGTQLFPEGVGTELCRFLFLFILGKVVLREMPINKKGIKGRDRSLRQKKTVEGSR